jgi:hypothetical protein
VHELSRDEYRFLQYHFVEFLVEHLTDVSRAFEGDLQEMLVLAILGQVFIHADEQGLDNLPISASRIADVTGIPRQTVRRKLLSLQRRGWAYQGEDGGWRLITQRREAAAREDLCELDKRGTERLLKLVRTLKDF